MFVLSIFFSYFVQQLVFRDIQSIFFSQLLHANFVREVLILHFLHFKLIYLLFLLLFLCFCLHMLVTVCSSNPNDSILLLVLVAI